MYSRAATRPGDVCAKAGSTRPVLVLILAMFFTVVLPTAVNFPPM